MSDRAANSHRKASSPRLASHRAQSVTSQNNWRVPESLEKVIPIPKSMLLFRQNSSDSNRQQHCGVIHKQGRRHEVGPTVWPSVENFDLMHQETSYTQTLTHSRPSECGSRQAIQTRLDHSNRVVSSSRGLPSNIQQVAPAKNNFVCHEAQQQVT